MNLSEFLKVVVTAPSGFLCIGYSQQSGEGFWNEWFEWPKDIEKIVPRVQELAKEYNVYFSSYLFKTKARTKENVIPSKTIQADLDNADLSTISLVPTVLVETSPGRSQAYWVFRDFADVETHEILSRKLTYSIPDSDHSGWPVGHLMRLPDTLNYKYLEGSQQVTVIRVSNKYYEHADIELLPDYSKAAADIDLNWINGDLTLLEDNPLEMLESIKDKLPGKAYNQYNIETKDRSAALWLLMCSAFRAGFTREQVYHLSWHSANNKFAQLRYNGKRELAKDVLRAEQVVNNKGPDIKSVVVQIRKLPGMAMDKLDLLGKTILNILAKEGEFFHTVDENLWYVRRDSGRPILVAEHSDYFASLMDLQFGLNSTEREYTYVTAAVKSYINSLAVSGNVSALSRYDSISNTLLFHTGKRQVLYVTGDNITETTNGSYDVVFPWNSTNEPVTVNYHALPKPWHEIMFASCKDNVIDMDKEDAVALLRTWVMFILMRDACVSRPILALFGQPGCLSGDTVLNIRRGDHSAREFSIRKLFTNFSGHGHSRWDRSIPSRILSEKNGIVAWREIKNVIYSGTKPTYIVKVEGCKAFRATEDHRFLTPYGYRKLSELKVGYLVVTKGDHIESNGRTIETRRIIKANFHPHARQKMVNGHGPYGSILYARAVLEADLNKLTVYQFTTIVNHSKERASTLKYLPDDIQIHHKDRDPTNNKLYNLQPMTKLEHDTLHGRGNRINFGDYSGIWNTSIAAIEQIEYYVDEPTYDIEMEDDGAPNFLVNNVVVHNSGKSTIMRRIYALLYGKSRSINAITSPENFDFSMATDPFVVMDNVDTWERWLPDRIALCASTSDIVKRKLYTDVDTITLKRQAVMGLTAHNPQFGREDVADRLLLITFERLPFFEPEGDIIGEILKYRNSMWGAILKDVQKVLRTSTPDYKDIPQFRVEDFARMGARIAAALDIKDSFFHALKDVYRKQKGFTLEEDNLLVTALRNAVHRQNGAEVWYSPMNLWSTLEANSGSSMMFNKAYGTPLKLSKKLWAMQDSLKDVFDIEWRLNAERGGTREWRVTTKNG